MSLQRQWENARKFADTQERHPRACTCGHRHMVSEYDVTYPRCGHCPCTTFTAMFA